MRLCQATLPVARSNSCHTHSFQLRARNSSVAFHLQCYNKDYCSCGYSSVVEHMLSRCKAQGLIFSVHVHLPPQYYYQNLSLWDHTWKFKSSRSFYEYPQ
ncbi:hypothetical protein H1C71_003401 [Ictidomys tridecemlineatus]|nr:hypothetical protein H1C71_003401 [Ictidomys tridecemlineatus]